MAERKVYERPDQEALNKTRTCFLVREVEYAQLIQKLCGTGIVQVVHEKLKESSRLFGVSKNGGKNPRLILDARRTNCHFIDPGYPELYHHVLFMQIEKSNKEALFVGKLEIDSFCHRLRLPEHLRTFPSIDSGKDKEEQWPRLVTVPVGSFHSLTISQVIREEIFFSGASVSEKDKLKRNSRTDLRSRFGRFVDNCFVLETNKKKLTRTYAHVSEKFQRA